MEVWKSSTTHHPPKIKSYTAHEFNINLNQRYRTSGRKAVLLSLVDTKGHLSARLNSLACSSGGVTRYCLRRLQVFLVREP